MAADNNHKLNEIETLQSAGEIDIDSVEVSILILAKHPNGQQQTATFLTKRGWQTDVMGNMGSALEFIVEKKPDVVVVSFNHPHPSINKLPEILTQTFNVICVGFVESADAASAARLAQAKLRYKMQGLPSGPSLQRIIRKILSEKLMPDTLDPLPDSPHVEVEGSDAKVIKGSAGDSSESGAVKPKRRFKELMGMETTTTQKGGYILEEGPGRSKEMLEFLQQNLLGGVDKSLESAIGEEEPPLEPLQLSDQSPEAQKLSMQALLEQAVETSFRKVCRRSDNILPTGLVNVSKVAVLPIESLVLHGYLIAGHSGMISTEEEEAFLKSAKFALEEALLTLGIPARVDGCYWVDMPNVNFNEWTESALFSLKLPNMGFEVGAAYFPTEKALPRPKRSAVAPDMYNVNLNEISCELPVNFKAYLHLEKGGKYVLYLRNGRTLQQEQKDRLQEKKVEGLAIKSVDLENFKAFVASIHLKGFLKKKAS